MSKPEAMLRQTKPSRELIKLPSPQFQIRNPWLQSPLSENQLSPTASAFATRNIFDLSPHGVAWFVEDPPLTLITSSLRNRGPWAERSVMSGLYPYAIFITELSMIAEMRRPGGSKIRLSPLKRRTNCGQSLKRAQVMDRNTDVVEM